MKLPRRQFIALSGTALLGAALRAQSDNSTGNFDVCIYGATASGIAAAISVAEQGLSVVIIEPSRWLEWRRTSPHRLGHQSERRGPRVKITY